MSMTTQDDASISPRIGSAVDLSRRMDRVEQRQEDQAREVAALTATVARVEANQEHATELNKLRFDALDMGLKSIGAQLGDFMKRIDGMISGEVETTQSRQGRELVEEYKNWRKTVEDRLDQADRTETRLSVYGRTLYLLTFGGGIVTVCTVIALIFSVFGHPATTGP